LWRWWLNCANAYAYTYTYTYTYAYTNAEPDTSTGSIVHRGLYRGWFASGISAADSRDV
jgi:hypothetical protein